MSASTMANHRHTFAPWFFIALILSNHGIAMASRLELQFREDHLGMGPNQAVERAHDTYRRMSCGELGVVMERVTGEAVTWLQGMSVFTGMTDDEVESIVLFTVQISSIADVADMKLCLPEVFNSGQVNANLDHFRSSEARFITAASSEEARDRFERAFSRLRGFQSDLSSLNGQVLNRHVLLPENVENPAVCPSPCTSCTREHNSWFREAETFTFKCIMEAGASVPEGEGFSCEEPTVRRSNSREQKSWCEVHDWEAVAAQTSEIAAKTACWVRSVVAPLQHGGDMSEMAIAACEKEMTDEALSQDEINELRRLDSEIDEVVDPGNLAAFSLFLIAEVVTAISELRLRSRAQGSLIETNTSDRPVSYTQGSWRCRRSVLSLTAGLFGAMIEIVIGVAYLAVMGTLGLLAAMSVFGADAVVATLAPAVGLGATTMGGVLTSASNAVSSRIAQFLMNRQIVSRTLREAGQAGAGAVPGATAGEFVVAAGTAGEGVLPGIVAQESQTIAHTIETLGGFGDRIMAYWPLLAGGLTLLGVGFGIWGLARIWHSFDDPHDCQSGYARVGGRAICHPALKYGEAHTVDCPGQVQADSTNATGVGTSDHLAFVCSRSNGGITVFSAGNCHADRA